VAGNYEFEYLSNAKCVLEMINVHDYIADSNLFKKFKVDDVLFVEYTCLVNDTRSDIWSHLNYFAYVLGGKKKWKTSRNEYMAESGDALFIKKGATNVYQYFEEKFFVLFIFVSDDFIRNVIRKNGLKPQGNNDHEPDADTVIPLKVDEICTSYFHSILQYFSQPEPPSELLLRTRFEELILSALTRKKNHDLVSYFHSLCRKNDSLLRDVMESSFHKNLPLEAFARMCAKSLSAFKRDFETCYGTAPGKWLIEKRLEHSKYLLETTTENIDDVMRESGFVNMSHFIRVFRNKFGVTPYQFKKTEQSV
jgi:AraC family transcriptional regulator, exoenzyme S synthesis regulatory protein ExsA